MIECTLLEEGDKDTDGNQRDVWAHGHAEEWEKKYILLVSHLWQIFFQRPFWWQLHSSKAREVFWLPSNVNESKFWYQGKSELEQPNPVKEGQLWPNGTWSDYFFPIYQLESDKQGCTCSYLQLERRLLHSNTGEWGRSRLKLWVSLLT